MKRFYEEHKTVVFAAAVAFFFLLRVCIAFGTVRIGTYPDELRYYSLARSFWNGQGLTIRNIHTDYHKVLYSLLIAPLFGIRDVSLRLKAIEALNEVLMMSCLLPLSLILRRLGAGPRMKTVAFFLFLIWPDHLFAGTFMTECLYYPLVCWSVFLAMERKRTGRLALAAAEGALCYVGFLCKELYLAVILASFLDLLADWIRILRRRKKAVPGEEGAAEEGVAEEARRTGQLRALPLQGLVMAGTFLVLHLALKATAFRGLGASYDQMGLSALLSVKGVLFFAYGLVYNFAGVFTALFLLPAIYPFFYGKLLPRRVRELYRYLMILLAIAVGTVNYTVTLREDMGLMILRVHMRYFGPMVFLLLLPFLFAFENRKDLERRLDGRTKLFRKLTVWAALGITCLLFKGAGTGSPVDQFTLQWYRAIRKWIGELPYRHPNALTGLLYVAVADAVILAAVLAACYSWERERAGRLMLGVFLSATFIGTLYGVQILRVGYAADSEMIREARAIGAYLEGDRDPGGVLYVTTDPEEVTGKVLDTYLDYPEDFYFARASQAAELMEGLGTFGEALRVIEPCQNLPYPEIAEKIAFVILDAQAAQELPVPGEAVSDLSGDFYRFYRLP